MAYLYNKCALIVHISAVLSALDYIVTNRRRKSRSTEVHLHTHLHTNKFTHTYIQWYVLTAFKVVDFALWVIGKHTERNFGLELSTHMESTVHSAAYMRMYAHM